MVKNISLENTKKPNGKKKNPKTVFVKYYVDNCSTTLTLSKPGNVIFFFNLTFKRGDVLTRTPN